MSLQTLLAYRTHQKTWSINNSTIYCNNISVIKFTMQLLIENIVLNCILHCAESAFFIEINLMKGDNWYLERLIAMIKTAMVYYCRHSCIRDCAPFLSHSKQICQAFCLNTAAECEDHLLFGRCLPPA